MRVDSLTMTFKNVETVGLDLPVSDELISAQGVLQLTGHGQDRGTFLVNVENIEEDYIITEQTIHDCCNIEQDCKSCWSNDKVYINYICISGLWYSRSKSDLAYSCWTQFESDNESVTPI